MTEGKFRAWVNPLQFVDVDDPSREGNESSPSLASVLRFLCTPGLSCDAESVVARYRQINQEQQLFVVAPAEQRILDKLIWPLHHAKAAYMTGNYLGTIALCGFVAEMVAVLLFDLSEFEITSRPMTPADQASVFGSRFENLGQKRRVEVLHAYGIVTDESKRHFDLIRSKRRKYLHFWSEGHDDLPEDAVATYLAAVAAVVGLFPQKFDAGRMALTEAMKKYLKRSGAYEPQDEG